MKHKIRLTVLLAFVILVLGMAVGSVFVTPADSLTIVWHKLTDWFTHSSIPASVKPTDVSIIWNMRLPRALLAFVVGAALSVSGAVMQSILKNPLASSYTLGVSSGASLGAALVLLLGITIPVVSMFTLPILGFAFGLGTILLSIAVASRLDSGLENNTIILTGMVISLFTNAIVTLVSAVSREHIQRLIYWQMGSFSLKDWKTVFILAPITLVGIIVTMHYNRELDMLTFGEEQAKSMGVNTVRIKWVLLIVAAAITGSAISFVGVIGFVDLVAPHVVRKIFGARHRYVIPMSAVLGGAFMVACDLVARTIVPNSDLPVGAITAIIGAPFFAYVYFSRRKEAA